MANSRIQIIDSARGVALIAMAIFHFTWDLDSFGLIEHGTIVEPQWKYFARTIAASFLILVGFSAYLAHHNGFRPKTFIKRLAMVLAAAILITIATWFTTPSGFIFFGILHNIALSSILVLAFLRLPIALIAITSMFFLSGKLWLNSAFFDAPIWWWSGLSQITPKANDYVPMFPWFGWVLAGLVLARLLARYGYLEKLLTIKFNSNPAKILNFFGRHSLIFYLVHQPILISLIYLYVRITADI